MSKQHTETENPEKVETEKKENLEKEKSPESEVKNLKETIEAKKEQINKLSLELEENKTKTAQYLNTASYYKNEAETIKKDFERYKERNKNIELEAKKSASETVAKKLLPILDNFDQAISKVTDGEIMRGLSMIYSSLSAVLTDLGLVEIICKNEPLNPEFHNCINAEPTENSELDGCIANVYQKGYKFEGTNEVVRPATVSVYKFNS